MARNTSCSKCTLPYRENLLNDINVPNFNAQKSEPQSCKEFYCLNKTNSTSSAQQLTHYLTKYISDNRTTDDIVSHIYLNKISLVKEIKLREFNFKLLHRILP